MVFEAQNPSLIDNSTLIVFLIDIAYWPNLTKIQKSFFFLIDGFYYHRLNITQLMEALINIFKQLLCFQGSSRLNVKTDPVVMISV